MGITWKSHGNDMGITWESCDYYFTQQLLPIFSSTCLLPGKGVDECHGIIAAAKGSLFVGVIFLAYIFAAHVCGYYIGSVKANKHRISFVALGTQSDVGQCFDRNGKK